MTRGVAGTAGLFSIVAMVVLVQENGGSAGEIMTPDKKRDQEYDGNGQRREWRYVSFLEARCVVVVVAEAAPSSMSACWRWERAAILLATESSLKSVVAVECADSPHVSEVLDFVLIRRKPSFSIEWRVIGTHYSNRCCNVIK